MRLRKRKGNSLGKGWLVSESGPLTEDQVDDLLDRSTDAGWLAGMRAQPDGQAILNSKKAIFAAASRAVMQQADNCSISTASTGSPGRCDLIIIRPDANTTAVVPKGFTFVDSRGVEMQVALDIPVERHQTSIVLPLRTIRMIDLVNNADPAFDDLLVVGGLLDVIIAPTSPLVLDSVGTPLLVIGAGIATYGNSTAITGATMDWLSVLGEERGCYRQPGEDGENYRLRVRALPDAVTPTAIAEAVHGAQVQGHLPSVYLVEPYRDQASDAAREAINLVFADSVFCDDGFCDDPFGVDVPGKLPFRTCETPSMREGRAYFRLSVAGVLHEPDGLVLYADDGFCDDPAWGYPDIGMHPVLEAALRGIQEEARVKHAGGVQFDTYVECATMVTANEMVTSSPTGIPAWVLSRPAGKAWLLREGLVTVTRGSGGPIDPATDSFMVALQLIDSTVLASGWSSAVDGMPLRLFELERLGYRSQQVTGIACIVRSSVSASMRAVGTFWTTEMTL
jgi:hypothetical protein